MLKKIYIIALLFSVCVQPVFAVSDPRLVTNNKVGINILSPEADINDASLLVNNNGDWGWVVVVIRSDERNVDRWQSFLNTAAKDHLIPIIRIATTINKNGYWNRPTESDAQQWADFLSKLYFPTKNKYIQIYNEVNHASEWGGQVDPAGYSFELNKTIKALKAKSDDFFVLNAPLDLAAGNDTGSMDAARYYASMNESVPDIFSSLDGWASHSYPNPNFLASPTEAGRFGLSGYKWELNLINDDLGGKNLPVFITETGWRRTVPDSLGLSENQISDYYKIAFNSVWSDNNVVVVAPFVLEYSQPLFDQFSFKFANLGLGDIYYKYFYTIENLPKEKGLPQRVDKLGGLNAWVSPFMSLSGAHTVHVAFKNVGNYVWHANNGLSLSLQTGGVNYFATFDKGDVYPGQEVQAKVDVKGKVLGSNLTFNLAISNDGTILSDGVYSLSNGVRLTSLLNSSL